MRDHILFLLVRLIALVRCYAGTLVRWDRPMLKKNQHTHGVDIDWPSSRSFPVGWSLLIVDDVDSFLAAPGFDQSTILFLFFFV